MRERRMEGRREERGERRNGPHSNDKCHYARAEGAEPQTRRSVTITLAQTSVFHTQRGNPVGGSGSVIIWEDTGRSKAKGHVGGEEKL